MATLTYVYADSTAVVGPLAARAEPHCYDLCVGHAGSLTAPRGWQVVRHQADPVHARTRSIADLEALANAVREAARPGGAGRAVEGPPAPGRRTHLRAVPTSS